MTKTTAAREGGSATPLSESPADDRLLRLLRSGLIEEPLAQLMLAHRAKEKEWTGLFTLRDSQTKKHPPVCPVLDLALAEAEGRMREAERAFTEYPARTIWGVGLKLAWACAGTTEFHDDAQNEYPPAMAIVAALNDAIALASVSRPVEV